MKRSVLAAKKLEEVKAISKMLGADISRAALPKARDVDHLMLFRLRAIRQALEAKEEKGQSREELMAAIDEIEGIGPATMERIREGLQE